ncbi:MAG: hypothetical protein ACYTFK_09575, partial [Planctomycetota bacterium]
IDCENAGRAFDFHSEETIQAIVAGFTITNGRADYGGAIRCANSSPKIMDCIITVNTATNRGGGLYLNLSGATIAGCVISNNTPDGIWIESGAAYLLGTIQFPLTFSEQFNLSQIILPDRAVCISREIPV